MKLIRHPNAIYEGLDYLLLDVVLFISTPAAVVAGAPFNSTYFNFFFQFAHELKSHSSQ